jgi:hypothetical protein
MAATLPLPYDVAPAHVVGDLHARNAGPERVVTVYPSFSTVST